MNQISNGRAGHLTKKECLQRLTKWALKRPIGIFGDDSITVYLLCDIDNVVVLDYLGIVKIALRRREGRKPRFRCAIVLRHIQSRY